MNKAQLTAMWIGLGIAVVTLLFPPIEVPEVQEGAQGSFVVYKTSYDFLLSHNFQSIVLVRLALELLIVALLTLGAIVTLKNRLAG